MRHAFIVICLVFAAGPAWAQDPPPKIGPFVVDLHGSVPRFPKNDALAASREMDLGELPGRGVGMQIGAHVYFFHYKAITFGAGGALMTGRSKQTPPKQITTVRPATETFTSLAPQLSFNFGTGNGWSYLSGGLATSKWSIVPEGAAPIPGDSERLKTINYGGGARWFTRPHVAFSFDVRLYAINPGPPNGALAGSPRTTLMVISAGVSVK